MGGTRGNNPQFSKKKSSALRMHCHSISAIDQPCTDGDELYETRSEGEPIE